VTPGFFAATGIQPFLGRFIIEGDVGASPPAVAVLSHDLWVARFGSAPSVIGQQIELDEQKFTVVGVAPRGFQFPGATLIWTSKAPGLVATAR
jgi:putative ABC transport system permease protein